MDNQEKKLAKKLANIAAGAEESEIPQIIGAVKKYLDSKTLSQKKAFLKTFTRYLKVAVREREVIIEHAGVLSDESVSNIVESLQQKTDKKLSVKTKNVPELIAGLRVSLGDNVYDMSIAGRLNAFKTTIS